jgi:hypothetical protein
MARAGGLASARSQREVRRSKNEIEFARLCKLQFGNVLENVAMFDGWDADVILPALKIAVLWNGKWHYESIANHNLAQVQARDKIKLTKILEAGYTPYVIKDLGRHNPLLVQEEFEKFIGEVA